MEKITLIKDNQKRVFSLRAAQIAQEHFGWVEFQPLPKPIELVKGIPLKKTLPPLITKPLKSIEPEYTGDEKKDDLIPEVIKPEAIAPESQAVETEIQPGKKTRKAPVRSKSVK